MATEGGANALDESGCLGRIEKGYKADLISIDLEQPHLLPTGSYIHTLLECVNANDVMDMIVEGKALMRNREVLTLDEEKILFEAKLYRKEMG